MFTLIIPMFCIYNTIDLFFEKNATTIQFNIQFLVYSVLSILILDFVGFAYGLASGQSSLVDRCTLGIICLLLVDKSAFDRGPKGPLERSVLTPDHCGCFPG